MDGHWDGILLCWGDYREHDQFEESTEEVKPLTEEEKAAQLELLRKK